MADGTTTGNQADTSASPPPCPPFPEDLRTLVEKFKEDLDYYKDPTFKEHNIRRIGIDPVLTALGWDVANKAQRTTDREVFEEDSLNVDGGMKAPDYGFAINKARRFFLEAKKPAVNVDTDKDAAFQIRRYCWTAGLPLGILTDFEEWSVYDCRAEPRPGEGALVGRIRHFRFDELEANWEWLCTLFGRAQVASGSLARFAADNKEPKGTLTVDEAFLAEIRGWRQILASDIHMNNPTLTVIQLNRVVQDLIDRIVFLRIAEARGLEASRELLSAANEPDAYARLLALFQRADDRYNSGLFHFKTSKGRSSTPDAVAPMLQVAPHILKSIVERLYYPHPYEFSVMPADILGRVYEQFLGEIITIDGTSALVETKPDVRKAGGVYYTPQPVVEYIVQNTVGPLIAGLTPRAVERIKVVDPACGSGSFLIVAFQYLIDWHTEYYAARPTLMKKHLTKATGGSLRLSTAERKRILLNNIYGVDIDASAVEVTKLSLLLKVIEGQQQLEFNVGRILPDLDANIRCGNSLIGTDFQMPLNPTDEEVARFNPFDWSTEFRTIFTNGGKFTAVIGNPPYLNIDAVWGRQDPRLAYIKSTYRDVYADKTDIFFYFLVKAAEICDGEIGFIVSRAFLEAAKARKLRAWLAQHARIRDVLDFRDALVFKAGINTAVVRYTHATTVKNSTFRRFRAPALPPGYTAATLGSHPAITRVSVAASSLDESSWNFGDPVDNALLAKIDAAGVPVGRILHVGKGMETAANRVFEIPSTEQALQRTVIDAKCGFRRARTQDIQPFQLRQDGPVVLYGENKNAITDLPPAAQDRLNANRGVLEGRAAYIRGNCDWWRFTWPLHKEHFSKKKILSPYRARVNRFAVDDGPDFIGFTDTTALYDNNQPESLHYIAAILNSDVLIYRHGFLGKLAGGGTYEFFENTISLLPIPRHEPGTRQHDDIAQLARQVRTKKSDLSSTKIPAERAILEVQVTALLAQINDKVADLFGLAADEREHIRAALTD